MTKFTIRQNKDNDLRCKQFNNQLRYWMKYRTYENYKGIII